MQKTTTTVAPLATNPINTTTGGLGSFTPMVNPAAPASSGLTFGSAASTGASTFSTPAVPTTTATGFSLAGGTQSHFGMQATGFGQPATTKATFGTGLFSTPSTAPTTQLGTSTTSTGFNIGGSFTLGTTGFTFATPQTTAAMGFTLGAQTTTSAGLTWGATPQTTTSSWFSTPQTTTTATGFALGGTTQTTTATGFKLGTPATSTTSGFSIDKSATTTVVSSLTTPVTSAVATSSLPVTSSSTLKNSTQVKFSQLEENINKWTIELEEQEKVFMNQVAHINEWDRLLLSNGDKIVSLNNSVEKLKLEQQQLDHELDFIVAQQRELEECLVPLEKDLADITVSDSERDATYRLAENLNTQLRHMSEDMKVIIEGINEKNKNQDTSDPIVQIGRILNAHMNSLQWIDQNTTLIKQQLDQVSKLTEIHRKENDSTQNI